MSGDLAVVFGGTGALGSACVAELEQCGVDTVVVRHADVANDASDPDPAWLDGIPKGTVTRVVWAQGRNAAGGIVVGDITEVNALLEANVVFVVKTMRVMLDAGVCAARCRVVILSSVWQDLARQEKLAYVVSKAAVAGLVRSLAADLGPLGIAVNAVAPGVIDSPMARANLTPDQIGAFFEATPAKRLCSPSDVARVARWLTSPDSDGVNAATIPVDGGWSEIRYV